MRIYFPFTFYFVNSNCIVNSSNLLYISRNHYDFTTFLANQLEIYYLLCELTSNSLSSSGIHWESPSFLQLNLISIHYFFVHSLSIHFMLREFTWNSLFFANSLSIQYLFCKLTTNSLLFLRIHVQFTIYIANSLGISYLFRELTMNLQPYSRIYFKFPVFFANSLRIHY